MKYEEKREVKERGVGKEDDTAAEWSNEPSFDTICYGKRDRASESLHVLYLIDEYEEVSQKVL